MQAIKGSWLPEPSPHSVPASHSQRGPRRHRQAGRSFPGSADLDTVARCVPPTYPVGSIGKSLCGLLSSGLGVGWEEENRYGGFD